MPAARANPAAVPSVPSVLSAAPPFLLIDSGNSRIKWALADDAGTRLAAGVFEHASTPAEWGALPGPASIWVSNVAGQAAQRHIAALLDAHWPRVPCHTIVSQARQCGVVNRYRDPAQLGSDRWAGLIGAHAAYPGEALLIATLGTATTLEALLADGTFAGGLIAPGWASMMRALGQHTAQLPALSSTVAEGLLKQADRDPARTAPPFAVDTPTSLSEGCLLAQAALLERAWHDLTARLAAPARLVLGGGAAAQVAPVLTIPHTRHDHLVLAGLALIAGEFCRGQPPMQHQAMPGATP